MPAASLWRLLPLAVMLVAGAVLIFAGIGPAHLWSMLSANGELVLIQARDQPLLAVVIYVATYAALMMVLLVPAWICTAAGGYIFGTWLGTTAAVAGATLGATAVFLAARGGLPQYAQVASPFLSRFKTEFQDGAHSYLVFLRLVPVVPFVAVNILAAIAGVSTRTFVGTTVVGILPSTLIYAGLGAGARSLSSDLMTRGNSVLLEPGLLLPLLGLAVLALLPVVYRRYRTG